MLTIDGSLGEGGGQIVRTSLALAMLTGTPVHITNLRARRSRPGLMRQHLAAVQAASKISDAEIRGAALGSTELMFTPNAIEADDYLFQVQTAGSTTLILQTILPALMTAEKPSTITLTGGTHNPMAPPFDFLQRAYLPLVNRVGPHIEAILTRPGFYPTGGGEFTVSVKPSTELRSFDLIDRGELRERKVQAWVSRLATHIAQRECQTIATASGWPESAFEIKQIFDSRGPGNVVMIELVSEHVTELFTGFGERGRPAEDVAWHTWQQASAYLESGVPVGPELSDQLLLPLGLAAHQGRGGSFRTMALTSHSRTHIQILQRFLQIEISVEERSANDVLVTIQRCRERFWR